MRAFLFLVIYILGVFVTYFIFDFYDPYNPNTDSWGDGDSNKGMAFMWPIVLVFAVLFSPFFLINKGLNHIRESQDKKRKTASDEVWKNLIQTSSDKILSNFLSDMALQTFPQDTKLTIHVGTGQNEIIKIECGAYDLAFARDIASKNKLLDKPIQDMKTSYLKEDGNETMTIDVYL